MPDNPMSSSSRAELLPEPDAKDVALGLTRAALTAIPVIGGSVTELMSLVITPSVGRRRDEWLKGLADGLDALEAKVEGFQVGDLAGNEGFVSSVIEASKTAIATHKEEKREALRNALLNVALGRTPDEDQQQIFLRYIEELTVWHIKFMVYFRDPQAVLNERGIKNNLMAGGASHLFEDCYPELSGRRTLYDQIAVDLDSRGLIGGTSFLHSMMTAQGMVAKRTTPLADEFLSFIALPIELRG